MNNSLSSNGYMIFINEEKNCLILLAKTSGYTFKIDKDKIEETIELLTEAKKLFEG